MLAQSLDPQEQVLERLGAVMLLFGAAGVIAAGMAGWGVARNGLRPVRRLTTSVEHIARTEDLTPLPVEGDDEIARLATAFNQMLTALVGVPGPAAPAGRRRRARAAHPAHLAAHQPRPARPGRRAGRRLRCPRRPGAELLEDVRAQIEELTTLIGDLVELARDEPLTHVVESVDLAEVVDRAVARVRRRAPGRHLRRGEPTRGGWSASRPPSSGRSPTCSTTPPSGAPRTARSPSGSADGVLTVDDQGPGIAPADLPHVFDRFYRSQESRSMPGSGLGLSIVRQVPSRHSGAVAAGELPLRRRPAHAAAARTRPALRAERP